MYTIEYIQKYIIEYTKRKYFEIDILKACMTKTGIMKYFMIDRKKTFVTGLKLTVSSHD